MEEGASGAAIVFYCCLTNYRKLSGIKHHPLSSSRFCGAVVWGWCDCVLCSGTRKVGIKVSAGLSSHLGTRGKSFIPKLVLVGKIQFLAIVGSRALFRCWLSARGHSQILEATCILCPVVFSTFKPVMTQWIVLMCQISLLFWDKPKKTFHF